MEERAELGWVRVGGEQGGGTVRRGKHGGVHFSRQQQLQPFAVLCMPQSPQHAQAHRHLGAGRAEPPHACMGRRSRPDPLLPACRPPFRHSIPQACQPSPHACRICARARKSLEARDSPQSRTWARSPCRRAQTTPGAARRSARGACAARRALSTQTPGATPAGGTVGWVGWGWGGLAEGLGGSNGQSSSLETWQQTVGTAQAQRMGLCVVLLYRWQESVPGMCGKSEREGMDCCSAALPGRPSAKSLCKEKAGVTLSCTFLSCYRGEHHIQVHSSFPPTLPTTLARSHTCRHARMRTPLPPTCPCTQ